MFVKCVKDNYRTKIYWTGTSEACDVLENFSMRAFSKLRLEETVSV